MKTIKSILFRYLIVWIVFSATYFFLSEQITKLIAPGYHDVSIWIIVVSVGLSVIFLIVLISLLATLIKFKRRVIQN